VEIASQKAQLIRFATFEVDLQAGELRKGGLKLKLSGQPFQVLAILLERPGGVFTREELQKRLWPDTFVDVDHNLNTAINKIREVLGDAAENPRFVETLPRKGYRFIGPVDGARNGATLGQSPSTDAAVPGRRSWALSVAVLVCTSMLLAVAGLFIYKRQNAPASPQQRRLTRVTFDDGLQIGATWSPDGRFLAYSSDRGGKFDIWVQQVRGGNPVQVTKGPRQNWQPDWSPDGNYIAYRSEDREGALYVIPALGGAGLERKIAEFGYYPRWSPDSSEVLFQSHFTWLRNSANRLYVVDIHGGPPREILTESLEHNKIWPLSAVWHPDGKRVTVLVQDAAPSPSFWTIPVEDGIAVRSEIAPDVVRQLKEISAAGTAEFAIDFRFAWAPSGNAIFLERTLRGTKNVWKMDVDPGTLRVTAMERLTTGPGFDTEPAVSADGTKLAFTGGTRHVRVWLFSFDATSGRVTGKGEPVTSMGIDAWWQNLSQDGKKLAFCGNRAGNWSLWERSLTEGRDAPLLFADDEYANFPLWSPDGTRLAYTRGRKSVEGRQLAVWSTQSRTEESLTSASTSEKIPYDWSADGKWILASLGTNDTDRMEIWQLSDDPHARVTRKILSDPAYDLYQPHVSPDSRWIVFQAVGHEPSGPRSRLYATLAAGGPWIQITDGKHWDDKPRWSPDGKTIYFVSGRDSVYNVWGIHFNPASGKLKGEPFQVTAFKNPGPMVPMQIQAAELSLTQDKLVLTMEDRSGSIWVLDNVNR
jgi:Tol biopolymer transport system component/DNA-binding winged helix-turn-helix (wHTH) protein